MLTEIELAWLGLDRLGLEMLGMVGIVGIVGMRTYCMRARDGLSRNVLYASEGWYGMERDDVR